MRGVSEVGHGDVAFTVVRNLLLIIFKGSHQKNTKFLHSPKRGGGELAPQPNFLSKKSMDDMCLERSFDQ